MIDLSLLNPPDIVEIVAFEAIYQEILGQYQALMGDQWNAALESDPVVKLLELSAWREMLLRARTNDAARACMLAYAGGASLEHLGAFYGLVRAVLDPGNPAAIPPVAPTMEGDARFRRRIQAAPEKLTAAGPDQMYIALALDASPRVADVLPSSPTPGHVVITVLSTDNNGVADAGLLAEVLAYLSAEERRPLTDWVTVQAADIETYALEAVLYCYPGPATDPILAQAQTNVTAWTAENFRLGYDVRLSAVYAQLHVPGVQRVELSSPAADIVISNTQAARCTGISITVAGRDV